MFINIGGKYIRTGDIRIIDEKKKVVIDYQGTVHPLGVNAEKLVAQVNEHDKDNCGLARIATTCEPLKPKE